MRTSGVYRVAARGKSSPAPGTGEEDGAGPQGGVPAPDRYEEFLKLFARDRERVFTYIYSLLPRHNDAEDVFQQCSLILWRKFVQFDPGGDFLCWACGIAHYEVRNFVRVSSRDRLHLDLDLIGQIAERRLESIERDEDRLSAMRRCLEKLKGPERDLIQFVYAGDRPVKDLADSTGRAVQTLYNQLSRVRRKLFYCVQRALAAQE